MKHVMFLIVAFALTACTVAPEPIVTTSTIAGNWSGEVKGKLKDGQELDSRTIQLLIMSECTAGKICGKVAEDGHCPGDLILLKVDGFRFEFLSQAVSSAQHICGFGDIRMIELEIISDVTIEYVAHNGVTLSGILKKKK